MVGNEASSIGVDTLITAGNEAYFTFLFNHLIMQDHVVSYVISCVYLSIYYYTFHTYAITLILSKSIMQTHLILCVMLCVVLWWFGVGVGWCGVCVGWCMCVGQSSPHNLSWQISHVI